MEITIGKQKIPLITGLLVAVNVVVYLVLEWLGSTEDGYFMVLHGALYGPAVLRNREFYRIFTAMFLHFGPAQEGAGVSPQSSRF